MNILFEIADKDLLFIGLGLFGLVIFGVVIFFVVNKDKVKPIGEEERFDNEPELFPDIKPVTKEQQEAKEELERVFNQMAADLEAKKPEVEAIDRFEREQEENAIISYQELLKQVEAKKNNELKEFKIEKQETKIEPQEELEYKPTCEKNHPDKIAYEPIFEEYHKEEIKQPIQLELEIEEPKKEEPKKFKNSDIISPIFGIQGSSSYQAYQAKEKEPMPEAPRHAYEEIKVAYESEDNAEFLSSLKEFRKNL